jgi:hypothetical protein
VFTGEVNFGLVGQAALGGAIGGALSSGGGLWQTGKDAAFMEHAGVAVANQVSEGVITAGLTGEDYHMDDFGMDVGLGAVKGAHYYRNELNTGLPGTIKDADAQSGVDVNADYHKLGGAKGNVKRVFADGREAVYDSDKYLVTNKLNMGTYNYINPGDFKSISGIMKNAGHFFVDMLPYTAFGNTAYDGSSMAERTLPWVY